MNVPFKFLLLCLVMVISVIAITTAQVVGVSNMQQNVVYLGNTSTLKIVRENTPCNSITASTDNGSIKKIGPCEFEFKPVNLGMAQIVIKSNKGTYNYLMRVEGKGAPAAFVGSSNGGSIGKSVFQAQTGIYGKQIGGDGKDRFKVSSYSFMIVRDNKTIEGRHVNSNRFDKDVVTAFSKLAKHDIVLFYNIVADDNKQGTIMLQPIQFLIL